MLQRAITHQSPVCNSPAIVGPKYLILFSQALQLFVRLLNPVPSIQGFPPCAELCLPARSLPRRSTQPTGRRNQAPFPSPSSAVTTLGFQIAEQQDKTPSEEKENHPQCSKQRAQPVVELPSARLRSETDPAVGTRSLSPPL